MKAKDSFVAFIPVRGGSKSIPLKNIKLLNGKPLLFWTLDAALNCKYIDHVYISTDCQAIREKVEAYLDILPGELSGKLLCIDRSPETATDTASTESALLEFSYQYEYDHVILIQATSPLLEARDLESAVEKYLSAPLDSLLSVVRQKRFIWQQQGPFVIPQNYDPLQRPRRQDFDGFFVENGAFYITQKSLLEESQCRISGTIGHYEMDEATYFEIDEPNDWMLIEHLLKKREQSSFKKDLVRKANKIKWFIMDCDGVLTDGGMYYTEAGDELKKFNTRDGLGIRLLHEQNIQTAIITGENTNIVSNRAKKLKIKEVHLGVHNKLKVLDAILKREGLSYEEIAYIGDDLNDLEVIQKVGLSFTVADAIDQLKGAADVVTVQRGGQGAVREAAELILGLIKSI